MTSQGKIRVRLLRIAVLWLLVMSPGLATASGGLILRNDVCVLTIGFYEVHFTAYQPDARGNDEFCEHLPGAGKTIFVLDYLHRSLKEVPVDFRVVRDVMGKGQFVRVEDVEALEDIEEQTVLYQPPQIKSNGTMTIEHTFEKEGHYVAIVTAGHPSNDSRYTAVFPIAMGASGFPWAYIAFAVFAVLAGVLLFMMKRIGRTNGIPARTGASRRDAAPRGPQSG